MNIISFLFNGKRFGVPDYSANSGYSSEWMNKLVRGFQRNTTQDHHYICMVDSEQYVFDSEIEKIPFQYAASGWGCIMEAFRPDLCSGHRMIVGLDTIILGNVDAILSYSGECGLLDDPYRAKLGSNDLCNGIGIFSEKQSSRLWYLWQNRERLQIPCMYNGAESEMEFMRNVVPGADRLNRWYAQAIQSYKVHWKEEPKYRQGARIVYFHGDPKPPLSNEPYLMKHWI